MFEAIPPRIGILADDLTSAADGAGPFIRRGLSACVGRSRPPTSPADAIAVDMATRSMSVVDAAARARASTEVLRSASILYKTVDSTLRGHVSAEIEAVAAVANRSRVVFAPAFPGAGRVTVDGIQLVDGVPVAESAYAADPAHPVRTSRLSDLLPPSVRNAIILEAATQDELTQQVAAIPDPQDALWIGSPGMAIALAAMFPERPMPDQVQGSPGDALIVVGSANPASHAQADHAGGAAGVEVLRAPVARVADIEGTLARLVSEAIAAIGTGRFGSILATGGDTMEAILDGLGIDAFDLTGEVEPGFPTARTTYRGQPLALAMKAGGFGAPAALLRAARHLTSPQEVAS